MDKEATLFSDWIENLTVGGFINIVLIVSFILLIIYFVARTFKDDSNA